MSESIKLTTSDEFTERGIRFQVAKSSHEEDIWKLLCDSFFPQCPISRSTGLHSEKTFWDRMARKDLRKFIKKECIVHKDALSIVAVDTNNNDQVVGAMLGYSVTKDKKVPYMYSAWMRPLYPILPKKMVVGNTMGWYYENEHKAHPLQALEELKVDKMCQGEVLVASKSKRGFGLGRELFRLSMELAKKKGCDAYFSVVSGIYSQKIASDLNLEVLREYEYDQMTDHRGKKILNDTLEHTKLQVVAFRF